MPIQSWGNSWKKCLNRGRRSDRALAFLGETAFPEGFSVFLEEILEAGVDLFLARIEGQLQGFLELAVFLVGMSRSLCHAVFYRDLSSSRMLAAFFEQRDRRVDVAGLFRAAAGALHG